MTTPNHPYSAGHTGSDGKSYVQGPGNGFSYDASTLFPEMRFSTPEDAKAAAACCNVAFREGYARAKREVVACLTSGYDK